MSVTKLYIRWCFLHVNHYPLIIIDNLCLNYLYIYYAFILFFIHYTIKSCLKYSKCYGKDILSLYLSIKDYKEHLTCEVLALHNYGTNPDDKYGLSYVQS